MVVSVCSMASTLGFLSEVTSGISEPLKFQTGNSHARPRPEDAAAPRRGVRPPEHQGGRGAGAHRAFGHQQAHCAARRHAGRAAARARAPGRAADARRAGAAGARAHDAVHAAAHRVRRRCVQGRRAGPCEPGGEHLGHRGVAARRRGGVHGGSGASRHQDRHRGARVPGADPGREGRPGLGGHLLGQHRLRRSRAPPLPRRPAGAGGLRRPSVVAQGPPWPTRARSATSMSA